MSNVINKKLKYLPNSPGVYIFYDKNRKILYVGKATSLKDRVGSYFVGNAYMRSLRENRPVEFVLDQIANIEIRKTDTVLEAYILEQDLIKKLQPKYNAMGKDDKSFSYVFLTKEEFPKFIVARKTEISGHLPLKAQTPPASGHLPLKAQTPPASGHLPLERGGLRSGFQKIYGPYVSKKQIEIALKILRKIFPYHAKPQKTEKGCLDAQIGLCPGPYAGAISKKDYAKNIRGIRMILEGKKKNLIVRMRKEMAEYSAREDYEKAAETRNKIFALQHIQDVALIAKGDENFKFQISNDKSNSNDKISNFKIRIEGYDISNISGTSAVGSMVVFDNSNGELQANKNEYRKFKIKTIKNANDVGMMEEVLLRRFGNNWPRPDLILLDGGAGHLNAARKILRIFHLNIPILAVAKGPERKKLDLRSFGTVPEISKNIIEQIRDEAHRFAISYHRKLREKNFLE